jgi:uncharacterized membrane protein YfcA
MDLLALLIIPLSFIAYVLKGVATFGPGIILVPIGALLIGAKELIIVISFLDLFSNASLLKINKGLATKSFLLPMIAAMMAGSAIGAVMLTLVPGEYFDLIFGLILAPLGLWIIFTRGSNANAIIDHNLPDQPNKKDLGFSFTSGCMGGLSGITGPVLAWHLGKRYSRHRFRDIMIPILTASAFIRVSVFTISGSISSEIMILVILALPGLYLGLWIGNKLFLQISQKWFSRIVGSLISVSGIKLLGN